MGNIRDKVRASLTVEMSFLAPMILLLIMFCILAVFYYHDKNIISGAAYETAVVGSTKAREKDGVDIEELELLFRQRVRGKCILFAAPSVTIKVGDNEIEVLAVAIHRHMAVSVAQKAAITEPEKYIRNLRKLKNIVK